MIVIIEGCVKRAPLKENVLGCSTRNQPTFHSPPANKPTFKRKISESIKQSQTQKGIFKKECTYVHQENTGRGVEG